MRRGGWNANLLFYLRGVEVLVVRSFVFMGLLPVRLVLATGVCGSAGRLVEMPVFLFISFCVTPVRLPELPETLEEVPLTVVERGLALSALAFDTIKAPATKTVVRGRNIFI